MKLKTVLDILKEISYLRSLLKRYGASLENGRYHLFDSFRAMSLSGSKSKAEVYFGSAKSTPKKKRIAKVLNKIGYFKNNAKTTAEYEAFYSANNYDKLREIKLFSFKRGKILTLCTSGHEADKQLQQYLTFSTAYNMPKVEKKDKYQNSFEISMIEVNPIPSDLDALKTILECTTRFNLSTDNLKRKTAKSLIEFSYKNQEINDLLNSIAKKISPSLLEYEIPLCIQHGDLSKDNLMYGRADERLGFWWIDWEHVGERIFLYDLFFYIINSVMYFDDKAFNCYMNGDLDDALKSAFLHFGVSFSLANKKDWLLIFMIVFLKERVCDFSRIEALRMYCKFVEEHFGEEK